MTTNAERLNEVLRLMLGGDSAADITEYLVAEKVANPAKLIKAAADEILRLAEQPRAETLAWCIEAARHVYEKMMGVSDYAGALSALKAIVQISAEIEASPAIGGKPGSASELTRPDGKLRLAG